MLYNIAGTDIFGPSRRCHNVNQGTTHRGCEVATGACQHCNWYAGCSYSELSIVELFLEDTSEIGTSS